jgi:UDP-glucose 4-epimerase
MNILMTGASGYIGRNFIKEYTNHYKVKTFSLQNKSIDKLDFYNIDIVVHFAALVHQKIEYQYEKYYEVNVEYPVELAKKAKASGMKQFVFISTIAVYGEDKQLLCENTECNPITSYGISKREAEKKLQALEDENFVVSIIRPPMVYGKNAPGNIDPLVRLVKKVSVLPFAGIENRRSFIYIGSLCHMIDVIIQKQVSGVFLASDDKPLSTTRLIELIASELDKKVYLVRIPFFESLLKFIKPSFHKRLYGSLEVDNKLTMKTLFGEAQASLPYSVEDGIKFMIHGESR